MKNPKKVNKDKANKGLIIYQAKSGAIELRGDLKRETVWATQAQMVELFDVDQSVVSRHIRNIFKDKEIDQKSNMQKMHIANSDKPVIAYSLDVVLAVGYRTNSRVAIDFRQWVTKTLKGYITEGYVVNKKQIAANYERFLGVVEDIKRLLPVGSRLPIKDAIELVSLFAETWLSLEAYDKGILTKGKLTKKRVELTAVKLTESLRDLKQTLVKKREASELFGVEKNVGAVAGIVGNVMQSFGGKELYPTVEEKAAHLLYFMVKNHPYTDGNKRSGAYAFIWFLQQAGILNVGRLTPSALTALTIMVAESDPSHKEKVVKLILNLISSK